MELSNTTKARLVSGAATVINTAVAATVFDSKGIAAYQAVVGSLYTSAVFVPEETTYGAKEMAMHGGTMVLGGTFQSLVLKGIGSLIFGNDSKDVVETDDIESLNEVITEVTGLVNPATVEADA